MAKLNLYKLGPKASSFFCPKTRLKVVNALPGKVATTLARSSKAIKVAEQNGHIKKIDEKEFEAMISAEKKKRETVKSDVKEIKDATDATTEITVNDFKKMNKDQLFTYYCDEYEVEKDEKETFQALNKADMIEKLAELEEEAAEEEEE